MNFHVDPKLDHVGDLQERHLGRILLGSRRPGNHHRVLVKSHVLGQPTVGSAGITCGNVPSNRFQIVWAFQPIELFLQRGKLLGPFPGFRRDLGDDFLGHARAP